LYFTVRHASKVAIVCTRVCETSINDMSLERGRCIAFSRLLLEVTFITSKINRNLLNAGLVENFWQIPELLLSIPASSYVPSLSLLSRIFLYLLCIMDRPRPPMLQMRQVVPMYWSSSSFTSTRRQALEFRIGRCNNEKAANPSRGQAQCPGNSIREHSSGLCLVALLFAAMLQCHNTVGLPLYFIHSNRSRGKS